MLSLLVALSTLFVQSVAGVRIAVVGGGIGGTSAAYYMNQLFGPEVSIDLYEVNDRVGGRLDLIEVNDKYYESGGAIVHTKNKYMMKMIEDFGLKRCGESQDTFGITDGDSMLFSSSTWSWVTSAKLLWRYGYDVIRLNRLVNSYLDKFSRIYDALDSGIGFNDVADLLEAMDPSMLKLTSVSLAQYLRESGFGSAIIDELAAAAVRVNYGQTTGVHALVGMVALAGAGNELTSVCVGNREVAAHALRHSTANQLLRRRVTEISRQDGVYVLSWSSADAAAETVQRRHYDLVVMATPQTADHVTVKWAGFNPAPTFSGRYHNLSVTFLQAQLKSSLFSSSDGLPDDILCTEQCTGFNSLGRQTPTTSPPDRSSSADQSSTASRRVYKIFSDAPPSDAWLAGLLVGADSAAALSAHRLHWLAYPSYATMSHSQLQLQRFQLAEGLFHINAIEWGASAMEMSAIGARNVANLAFNYWRSKSGTQVEPPSTGYRQPTDEL